MAIFPVILDSCVLYPMYLRDTLLRAAQAGLYRVHWSEEILAGAFRNLIKDERISPKKAEQLKNLMQTAFPEAMIEVTELLIPCMDNHEGDRHILAAALIAKAHVIVTDNLKHFPDTSLHQFNIIAQSSDDFLLSLLDLSPQGMLEVLYLQIEATKKPKLTITGLLDLLNRNTPNFVQKVNSLITNP
ncbi:MAG: PIN domain-containing protein [Arthrospira sp. PLM2.Bin9]|nr:PIN domain-containing protein [Arthrospira sp. PLM2.Bin9]TVU54641.1 MAG: PIN domain-containing protein [Arthrospira sp. PLM2.Bin9]